MKQKTEPKEVVFTGRLTKERFEQICEERGYVPKTDAIASGEAPKDSIFSGHLTVEKLKELCYIYLELKSDSDQYDPSKHTHVISIRRQEDGSWVGNQTINGKLIKTRELIPEHALQALLTHG